jgi:hypothetical protein
VERFINEKGQAGLEFVIIVPVFLLALFLITIVGNQLYQKLSAQNMAYSHCMWDVMNVSMFGSSGPAFSQVVDVTKKTWNTEGVFEDYERKAGYQYPEMKITSFETKTCVASVTHDEWNKVGFGYLITYDPDVLVESKLIVDHPSSMNALDFAGFPPIQIIFEK